MAATTMASVVGQERSLVPIGRGLAARRAPVLAALLAVAAILALYADTAASIVAIWWRSQTFAHGFVVVPICLWLGWRNRDQLAQAVATPWWPGIVAILLAGALWFVMAVGDVLGLRQFALAFMVQAAIVTVVGLGIARVLAFPLLFLLFAVPAGEFLLPTLIDHTADFTVAALRATGIPVFREANHFVIPSGAWSVVEACSGLRYLIASLMIGVVFAAVAYRSPWRRAAFIAASIVVPIVANWLRAYLIVLLGHLSGNRIAVGVDHLIYGWLFFGVVMALLFWIGSFWSERAPAGASPAHAGVARAGMVDAPPARFYIAAAAAVVAAAIWRPAFEAVTPPPEAQPPALAAVAGAGGWQPSGDLPAGWIPNYKGFGAESIQGFRKDGDLAALYIAYYRNQAKGRELVTSGNALVIPMDSRWREMARGERGLQWQGAEQPAEWARIVGEGARLSAWRLFWVDGHVTGDEYAAKAWLAWSRLRGRSGDAALIVAFAQEQPDGDAARSALEALAPGILRVLEQTRDKR